MDGRVRLPNWATVFQAEIYAIEIACNKLVESGENPKYVKIFLDSQAAIKALYNREHDQNSVSRANKAINRLKDSASYVTVVWTRGYVGNIGNERADDLAKAGTLKTTLEQIDRPLCYLKESIKKSNRKGVEQ